jgi:hypothetical protein
VERELETDAPPLVNHAPAQDSTDLQQVLEQLQTLAPLLQQSDMQALEVHAGLANLASPNPEMLKGLNEAIAAFDFALAHRQCLALIEALGHPPERA